MADFEKGNSSTLTESTSVTQKKYQTDDCVQDEEPPKNFYLPIDAVTRIFSFLEPDDLEVARLVCRTWKNVIDRHRDRLPPRPVDVLHLSTNCEFTFALYSANKVYRYTCQKFWADFDTEMREKTQIFAKKDYDDRFSYDFQCSQPLMSNEAFTEVQNASKSHLMRCTIRARKVDDSPIWSCLIYNPAKRGLYARQLFTPPLIYYEKLRDLTEFANIHTLVLNHFSVNETTGDMLRRWVGPFYVKRCILHNVNLRAVSPKEFHFLITEAIVAEEYYFEYVHKALPNHFNADLFSHPTFLQAKKIKIGAIFDRSETRHLVRCNLSEEDLHKFIYRPEEGKYEAFTFRWDNFHHSEALLHRKNTSIFKLLESKR